MQPSRSQAQFASPARSLRSAPRPQRTLSLINRSFDAQGELSRCGADARAGPRRPKTTPKPRVQRLLLALGQGQPTDHLHAPQSIGAPSVFMTRLPDSPPRLFPARTSEPALPTAVDNSRQSGKSDAAAKEEKERTAVEEPPEHQREGVQAGTITESASAVEVEELVNASPTPCSIFRFSFPSEPSDGPALGFRESGNSNGGSGNDYDEVCVANDAGASRLGSSKSSEHPLEPEVSEDEEDCDTNEGEADDELMVKPVGPLPSDIISEDSGMPGSSHHDSRESSDALLAVVVGTEPGDRDQDDDYASCLEDRARVLGDEAQRQRVRAELEAYVDSLPSRTDDSGECLLEFPRNYQQVLSLMSQKDVCEEDPRSDTGSNSQKSWSRVLIQSGLSKQQAFGVLEDGEDGPAGDSGLAAKIALKMALVQQLDGILEEKLGRNLYPAATKKPKVSRRSATPESDASNASVRTFVTQPQSVSKDALAAVGSSTGRSSSSSKLSTVASNTSSWKKEGPGKKTSNFIERNKQVVANGMRANLTRDEELRLEQLLREDVKDADNSEAEGDTPATDSDVSASASKNRNEFAMTETDKLAIQDLIATKGASYQLVALDQFDDGPTDDALPSRGGRSSQPAKDNVIQENKRERAQRQRLGRIEQELRFLRESQSVVIVGDDQDGDDVDDCRSEKSCATVASVAASSTCSTRSGIISRRDFNCFLAQQKQAFHAMPTASAEEIRRLLLSVNRAATPSADVVTATTR